MTAKVMRLIDPSTGEMECKIDGARHFANIRPDSGGKYYRGSWQCDNGCKFDDKKNKEEKVMKKEKNTTSSQFGYTDEDFYILMDKAEKIYFDYILPNDHVMKKEIFDKIVEVSNDPKDIYLMTIAIEHLVNEEFNAYKDFCEKAEA